MILGKEEILGRIRRGEIALAPFIEENLGSNSLDLTLGDEFRVFKPFEK
ncbi:dCTP deaminase, partial [Candidatus Woesearchaeota archaeon]|nr:dCTP deaminase [Candidatus Woesearchaeota archaeon]